MAGLGPGTAGSEDQQQLPFLWFQHEDEPFMVYEDAGHDNKLSLRCVELVPKSIRLADVANLVDDDMWTKDDKAGLHRFLGDKGNHMGNPIIIKGKAKPNAGLDLMTAQQVISHPLPPMRKRRTPRKSKSKTVPASPRTFDELLEWEGFEDEMEQLQQSLDNTERRFLPVQLPGGPSNNQYAAAADESEVRAAVIHVAMLINNVADSLDWDVKVLGGGSNRSISQTDGVIIPGGSCQGTSEGEEDQDRPGPSQQGTTGVQQEQGTRKRRAEAAAGAALARPCKSGRVLRGEHAQASATLGGALVAAAEPAAGALSERAARAAARAERGAVGPAHMAPAGGGPGVQGQRELRGLMQGGQQGQLSQGQQRGQGQLQQGRRAQQQQQAGLHAEGAEVLACLEVKGDWQWNMKPGEQLLQLQERRPQDLLPAVYQLYGDMVMDEAGYGMVTNYVASVLFKRDEDVTKKVLYVSPTIGLDRLSLALLLLTKVARESRDLKGKLARDRVPDTPEEQKWRKQAGRADPKQKKQRGGQGGKQQGEQQGKQGGSAPHGGGKKGQGSRGRQGPVSEALEDSGWVEEEQEGTQRQEEKHGSPEGKRRRVLARYSFSGLGITGELVGQGHFGNVLKGSCSGQAAVIKLYHARHGGAEEAFLRELDAYEALAKLQGSIVPRLLFYGTLYPTDAFFLAMSDEGQDLESLGLPVSEEAFQLARAALQALHRAGVSHGDVRAANFVLRGDGSACVVDFERARVLSRPRSKQDRADVQADLAHLDSLRAPWG